MKQGLEYDFPEDMDQNDITDFVNTLDRYVICSPSEEEINATVEKLICLVPVKKRKAVDNKLFNLLKIAANEVRFISSSYWLISFALFTIGLCAVLVDGNNLLADNPYIISMILSPIPFILGVFEIFRGKEEGTVELELSCKMSLGEVIFSRLMIIGIYNILLNTSLSIFFKCFGSGVLFWKITLMWFTPFTVISGLGLLLVSKIRGSSVVTIFTSIWMILSICILSQKELIEKIMKVDLTFYLVLCAAGMLISGSEIKKYADRYSNFYERRISGEAFN
jgi:hypothetical protein